MTRFQAPPTELDGLVLFLDGQREAILNKLDGLTEEQARMRSTVSDLCMLTLVKHVAYVERRWVWCGIGDTEISGIYPDGDREEELSIGPDQTIESIRALYASIVDENRTRLTALTDIGAPLSQGVSPRWILLHLIEELARHAGHADIIRESIDGVVGT